MQVTRRGRSAPRTMASFDSSHSRQRKTSAPSSRIVSTTTPSTTWRVKRSRRPVHCRRRRRLRFRLSPRRQRPWPGLTTEHVFSQPRATSPTAMRPPSATTILYPTTPTSTALRRLSAARRHSTVQKQTAMPPIGCAPNWTATNPLAIKKTPESVLQPALLPPSPAPIRLAATTTSTAASRMSALALILPAQNALNHCVTINTHMLPPQSATPGLQSLARNRTATKSRQQPPPAKMLCPLAPSVRQLQILSPHQTIFNL